MEPPPDPSPSGGGAGCWSDVLQKKVPHRPRGADASRVLGSYGSSKGVSVAVVDANAIVHGDKLTSTVDRFVSVRQVLEEVRDPVSRQRLSFLPFPIETTEPSPEAVKRVVKFARETGDLQTLSDVDIKLIALTYMLEEQLHGSSHLKSCPPPLQMVNVKNFPEIEMPGWGSNVPNLAEWEALEHAGDGQSNHSSRILPLKDLNLNLTAVNESVTQPADHGDINQPSCRPKRFFHPKKEVKIDGKKMVASGIDASQGEDKDNASDWKPAVSRSTHRRYLRRKTWREMFEATKNDRNDMLDKDTVVEVMNAQSDDNLSNVDVHRCTGLTHCNETKTFGPCDLSRALEHMELKEDLNNSFDVENEDVLEHMELKEDLNNSFDVENEDVCNTEISSESEKGSETSMDEIACEQSCGLKHMSDSSVACVTSDFAMQNVILQMGLRLLAPGGMQIHQLHRWVLKCHACNKVTAEIGRIFCPKCGNGGTLRKVSVTVDENGLLLASRRPHIKLRGTKFSIPLPQGGRDAISKNFVLREDQIPHKFLHPKQKKKNNRQDDYFGVDDMFSNSSAKKAPLKPPVGKAVLVFMGKRNPNDNHFSRKH